MRARPLSAGLAPVSGGSIGFLGAPLVGPAPIISVVFQDYSRSLLPWKSNLDNVVFGVRRVGDASRREKRERADLKSKFARPRRWGEPGFEPSVPLRRRLFRALPIGDGGMTGGTTYRLRARDSYACLDWLP